MLAIWTRGDEWIVTESESLRRYFLSPLCVYMVAVHLHSLTLGLIILNSGSVFFESSDIVINDQLYSRSGHVDYVVYRPGEYIGTNDAISGSDYVYAYQIFNDADSDLSIDTFIVSLIPGTDIDFVGFEGDGKKPGIPIASGSGSSTYFFHLDPIGAGENSSYLVFSSPGSPTPGFASVNGEVVNSAVYNPDAEFDKDKQIYIPVPEPVSFVLFGGGLLMLRSKRRSLRRS